MNRLKKIAKLETIKDIIFNYELFASVYVIASVLWFFPFLGPFIDPILKPIFIWGGILLVYDFVIEKRMFKERYFLVFFGFFLSYGITIFLNIKGQFYMGIKHMIYSAITMLILFNLMKEKEEQVIKKYIYRLNDILIIIAMIASTISGLMYFFSVSIEMEYMGNNIRQGFIDHRLFGIYTSANTGATMAILAIVFMFINSFIKNNSFWKWSKWYKINVVIQLIYFALTLSRGGQVTLYVLVATFLLSVLMPKFFQTHSKIKSIVKIMCFFIVFCFGSMLVLQGIRQGAMFTVDVISQVASSLQKEEEHVDGEENSEKDTNQEDASEIKRIETGDDMSNGRFTIWSAGIHIWEKSPLFGVADIRIDEQQMKNGTYDISDLPQDEIIWLAKVDGNLHNSYIQILVNSGIVGSVIFVVIVVLIGIKYLRFLFYKNVQNKSTYYLVGIIFTVIVSMLANCCFENRILFDRQNPFGLLFWLYLGIGSSLIDYKMKKVKQRQDDGEKNSICM